MKFRTEIKIPKSDFQINHRKHLISFGSCFSDHIGNKLKENKFNIVSNPFGVLYNPYSVSKAIERLYENRAFDEHELQYHNQLYQSFMHHSSFSSPQKEECLNQINNSFKEAATFIHKADIFLITFGTAYVFRLKQTGEIVANCHKFAADTFDHQRLTVDEIVDKWNGIIRHAQRINPQIKFIFTVSPIRHWKDGAHENQISKSILHIAIDALTMQYNQNCFYFPSYEILLDELRDYRFFDTDMMHPAPIAIDYIWNRFGETYFDAQTDEIIHMWQKISRSLNHKPFNTASDQYTAFLKQTIQQVNQLQQKYPYLDLEHEEKILLEKLGETIE